MTQLDEVVTPVPADEALGSFHRLDTTSTEASFMLECPNGCQFKLSQTARLVLDMRWQGAGYAQIAEELERTGLAASSDDGVKHYYDGLVAAIKRDSANYRSVPTGYSLKLPLLNQRLVARVARVFGWLYQPIVAGVLGAGTTAAIAEWVVRFSHIPKADLTQGNFLAAYLFFLVSLALHEFGHASACVRYGAKPGAIGFILYLTFPALYSDVSSTWKLPRWQRVVVDLAGSYFQLVAAAAYVVAYQLYPWPPLSIAVFMIVGASVFNLNPLFKFDGYWVVSDMLGVPNLSKQAKQIAIDFFKSLVGRSTKLHLRWPRWVLWLLGIYSVLAFAAWSYFIERLIINVPRMVAGVGAALRGVVLERHVTFASAWHLMFTLFGVYFTGVFAYKMAQLGAANVRKLRRRTVAIREKSG